MSLRSLLAASGWSFSGSQRMTVRVRASAGLRARARRRWLASAAKIWRWALAASRVSRQASKSK